MTESIKETCPRCAAPTMSRFNELTREEKMLVEALPASVNHPEADRKRHRVCTRCLYVETSISEKHA